ncbi:hypothetical protein D5018_01050 [Parashewanella curva]|uniref:Uncharacterized protein n=1 Tax=Parashewanella curva TaxID=2338552 RepID=A0A3L8Q214_9GAMM|nr:hypothetical protein [Parashewanella curva]RLV61727.1 hypothetical protein D5018_01050 [Parashewanella curva]
MFPEIARVTTALYYEKNKTSRLISTEALRMQNEHFYIFHFEKKVTEFEWREWLSETSPKCSKHSAASVFTDSVPMPATINSLMGNENPALWPPEDFINKLISQTEGDMAWECSQVYLANLKRGTPLPMLGIKHTCDIMLEQLNEVLEFETTKPNDRTGIQKLITRIQQLAVNNYPYEESIHICAIFSCAKLVYMCNDPHNPKWCDELEQLVRSVNKGQTPCIENTTIYGGYSNIEMKKNVDELLTLPWHELTSPLAMDTDNFDLLSIHISALTETGNTGGIFSVNTFLKSVKAHFTEKVIFISFSPLSMKKLNLFTFLPFVPMGMIKKVHEFHDGGHYSPPQMLFHDWQHEGLIHSESSSLLMHRKTQAFIAKSERLLQPEFDTVNNHFLFFSGHEFEGIQLEYLSKHSELSPHFMSCAYAEYITLAKRLWLDIPEEEKQLLDSDLIIQSMLLFSMPFSSSTSFEQRIVYAERMMILIKQRIQTFEKMLSSYPLDQIKPLIHRLLTQAPFEVEKRFVRERNEAISLLVNKLKPNCWSRLSMQDKLLLCGLFLEKNVESELNKEQVIQ